MKTLTLAEIKLYLPLLLPLIILQLGLAIFAARKILKQKHFSYFNRASWLIIVFVFQFIGPICYFVFGRGEKE